MSRPPASEAEARELVERIVRGIGFVRESSLQTMPPDIRREVEEALLAKDIRIGASVLTLAKNLYTSKARFVFELLQNTDDNNYRIAQAAGQDPSVSFTLHPDRLVVDCNEDGFTEANLAAICDVGKSSKSGSQGYIGEKGIGFKSVFMAAWKVHIQSGHLSFSFVHRKGDSDMGMVMPMWEDPVDVLPQANHTRITLFLQEGSDAEQTERERRDIRDQFRELEPALLLFVRNLRCVDVTFCDAEGQQTWATSMTRCEAAQANRVILERRTADTGSLRDIEPEGHIYHVTEHTATNVARHDNRELPAPENAGPLSRQSKIVLAFPVTAQSVPVIEAQKVFAFLPMKQMGFNFLIQADFVIQANREDVVTTSARNQDLIRSVIDAFISTVHQFCQHESLQYTWMRYLPREGTHHWDPFWMTLVDGIKESLNYAPVVRTRGKGVLRRICDVKDRSSDINDHQGDPLLPDLDPEIHLSDSYARVDIDILKVFGLEFADLGHIMDSAERDLARPGQASRFRSPSTDDEWHTRVSKILLVPFSGRWDAGKPRVRNLAIIPLEDGSWVRAVDGESFYGSIGNIPIPRDLGLQIVASRPARNARRRELFNTLGVRSASTTMIRSRVLERYSCGDRANIPWETSLEDLKFLYLTHESRPKGEPTLRLLVYDHLHQLRNPIEHDLYIQDDNPYGAKKLVDDTCTGLMEFIGASFLDPRYLAAAPDTPPGMSLSYVEWLHDCVGVRRNLRIIHRSGTTLSEDCLYVSEYQEQHFLEFLMHVWPAEGAAVAANEKVLAELRAIPVPCFTGTMEPLSTCYHALEELYEECLRFTDAEILPFAIVPTRGDSEFLTEVLGLRSKNDLEFRLHILTGFVDWVEKESMGTEVALKALDIYRYIDALCLESPNREDARKRVFDSLKGRKVIFAPRYLDDPEDIDVFEWITPEQCLWDASGSMVSKWPLKDLYEKEILAGKGNELQPFFQKTLGVPDASYVHMLEELDEIKERGLGKACVVNWYGILQDMCRKTKGVAEEVRSAFENRSLVYVQEPGFSGWRSPSQCLWASTTNIDGKSAVRDQYADFEDFFTNVLGVRLVNLTMLHDQLIAAATKGAPPEQIKELLLDISSHLRSASNRPQADRVLQSTIFPVRCPGESGVTLCSKETEFFIVDREDLFDAFQSRVRYLDFSLKEVCDLSPFIAWAGLESRLLSRSVVEMSRVKGGVERPIRDTNHDVKTKAYALLRIAAKYRSPRFTTNAQALYDTLRTAETVEAAGIASTLVLRQDGHTHEHEVSESDLHIEERDGALKIYVPRDDEAWSACVHGTLPPRLLSWIMAKPGSTEATANDFDERAETVVFGVLNCDSSAVPMILTRNSVPSVDEVREVPSPVSKVVSPPATPTRARYHSVASPGEASSAAVTPDRLLSSPDTGDASYATPLTDPGDYDSDSYGFGAPPSPTPSPSVRTRSDESRALQEIYLRLLNSAVNMAERLAERDFGQTDVTDAMDNLSLQDDDVFTSTSPAYFLSAMQGQHVKIGAAGELFAFVLLESLDPDLTSFGRDNWQSTIRHHAAAHHRFADLTSWVGRETSDIVYDDEFGELTELLITKGHLSQEWTDKTPKYYIEVKSTLDRCETPFYVSHGQTERMRKTTNGPSGCDNQSEVYVIFRVFNLGTDATGLRIYVDPEEQRRTGKLRFKTDATYAVVPGEEY